MASFMMVIICAGLSTSSSAMDLMGCNATGTPANATLNQSAVAPCTPWNVPDSMWWPLAYWIFANSITAYMYVCGKGGGGGLYASCHA